MRCLTLCLAYGRHSFNVRCYYCDSWWVKSLDCSLKTPLEFSALECSASSTSKQSGLSGYSRKNFPGPKGNPLTQVSMNFRRKKEHGSKRWAQHNLPSPPEEWGLCVFCKDLNPGVNWSPTLNHHELQGWGFLGLSTNRNKSIWMFGRGLGNGPASMAQKQETEATWSACGSGNSGLQKRLGSRWLHLLGKPKAKVLTF